MTKARHSALAGICAGFLLLDQYFKYLARSNSTFTWYLWRPWIGWEYFRNTGIAFSIPLPQFLVVWLTPIILLFLGVFALQKKSSTLRQTFGAFLILSGALSNFIDRILFAATIDYIRLFTGVINIADLMIAFGALVIIVPRLQKEKASG